MVSEETNPVFNLYTHGSLIAQPRRNADSKARGFEPWVRAAFDEEDILPGKEKENFDLMDGHHLYYAVWRDRLDEKGARIMINIKSDVPDVLKSRIAFREELSLSLATGEEKMLEISPDGANLILADGEKIGFSSDGSIDLNISLDTSRNEISSGEAKVLLIVRLYANLSDGSPFDTCKLNTRFKDVFNRLGADVKLNREESLAVEIYVHFIIR